MVECCALDTDLAGNEQHKGLRQCDILSRGFSKILKRQAPGSIETSVFSSGHCFTFKKNWIFRNAVPLSLVCHFALTTEYITFVTSSTLCFLQVYETNKSFNIFKILALPLQRQWCKRDNVTLFYCHTKFQPPSWEISVARTPEFNANTVFVS
jgi:hypothetical protein